MIVDLLPIIDNEGLKTDFSDKMSFTHEDCEITAEYKGFAKNFAGKIEITAHVKATVNTKCARCLEPVKKELEIEVQEAVGEDGVELEGTNLNMDDVIISNIVVNLPVRFLCSENCKGLCSTCGVNLNKSTCNCKKEVTDERLKKLLDLLHD